MAVETNRLIRRFGSDRDRVSTIGEAVQDHTDRGTRVWLYSAIFWLTIVDLFGLVLALELISPNLFGGVPWLMFGRIRPLHVNGVIFAWLSMMCYTVMTISSVGTLVWKHPLADVSAKAAAPIGAAFTFLALLTGSPGGLDRVQLGEATA